MLSWLAGAGSVMKSVENIATELIETDKGDEEQVQNYINECLAVKAKYPKPLEG